ncbi:hypothetical protein KBD81_05575 [Candidatus Woesebacteria bacterium]|nr:hypothetical protein [Candidatus Woesebacteria bacterium]
MNISAEQLLPLLIAIPIVSLLMNFVFMIFLIIFIQKGKLKSREQQEIEKDMLKVIKEADLRATEIIEEAAKKGKEIINEAAATKNVIEEKLNKMVQDTTDSAQNQLDIEKGAIVEKFKEAYGRLIQQYDSETQVLVSNLQHEAREAQQEFKNSLKTETIRILAEMKDNSAKQIEEVGNDIKKYREHEFSKIDEQAQGMIKQYISDYFSSEITKDHHENILFQALDKFKKNQPKEESV